jgi:hypothetical protein
MFSTMRLHYATLGILILSLTALWSAVGFQPNAVSQETKRYVYQVVDVPAGSHAAMQTTLNEYGSTGWELVAIGMGDMTTPRLVFKK